MRIYAPHLQLAVEAYVTVHVPERQNPIVNRLNKTKVEREVDHEAERVERVKKENTVRRAEALAKVQTQLRTTNILPS